MRLPTGLRFGPYEIAAPIGAGGMGEVYRARDSKLGRQVALKVLPAALAEDAEYTVRFQREAQVLASLNHPNIASIYGLEESGNVRALVMELVEGPTLADRLTAGPVPLEEALELARPIAEALEYAREKGVIHRDLKPANVKLTSEGKVKVLDFGLAKAEEGSPESEQWENSPTLPVATTQPGMMLGSAAYMAPGQARGEAVDKRADIWAFWSPDSRFVGYFADGKLKKIDLGTPAGPGPLQTLCDAPGTGGATWSRDGVIVFGNEKLVAVSRLDANTRTADLWLIELARGISSRFTFDPAEDMAPVWSPDGKRIIFSSDRGGAFRPV